MSNEEALSFINAYFKKFPEIKDYMKLTVKLVDSKALSQIFLEEEFILEESMIKILVYEHFRKEQQLMPQYKDQQI